jgi:hypothetical protein
MTDCTRKRRFESVEEKNKDFGPHGSKLFFMRTFYLKIPDCVFCIVFFDLLQLSKLGYKSFRPL